MTIIAFIVTSFPWRRVVARLERLNPETAKAVNWKGRKDRKSRNFPPFLPFQFKAFVVVAHGR